MSWRPILTTGLSEVIGSWKTIAISRPHRRRSLVGGLRRRARCPSYITLPSRSTLRAMMQAHDRAGQHGLARARLADDAERLAPVEA